MPQPQNPYTEQEFIRRYTAGMPSSPYYQKHGITPEMGWSEAASRAPFGSSGLVYQGMGDAYDRWLARREAKGRYRELYNPTLMGTPTTGPESRYKSGVRGSPLPSPPRGMAAERPAPQAAPQAALQAALQMTPGQTRTMAPIDESARSAFLSRTKGAGGAGTTQAALKAGLAGSAKVLRKGRAKKKPTKTKVKEHARVMDIPKMQKRAAVGSNYDGTLLSIVISARRQAAQNELAFVPVYDYKNSRVVLVRADGVDMVYNMKDRRHRDALRSGLLKAKHDPTEVMQMADRVSAPLKRSIAKDINTEEDVIKALSWM